MMEGLTFGCKMDRTNRHVTLPMAKMTEPGLGTLCGPPIAGIWAFISTRGGNGLVTLWVWERDRVVRPEIRIVGCWPRNSAVLYESIKAGRIIEVDEQPTLSDSTDGALEDGSITLGFATEFVDDFVLVSEEEIANAMRIIAEHERWIVEGAAGVAVAGYLQKRPEYAGKTVAIILCGRNIAYEKLRTVL